MAEEWIIRVQGKEYGPADLATLREWRREGRLLPQNPARRADVDLWTTAAEIPDLFESTPPVQIEPAGPGLRRSFREIVVQAFRIYGKGFFQFLCLTLLVVLPWLCGQLTGAMIETSSNVNIDLRTATAAVFTLCMLVLSVVLWPIYIAGIQILTAGLCRHRRIGFLTALNEAVKFWPRVATLCVFVYGVFFLLTVFAFGIAAMIVAGASSLFSILFALALLAFQVWLFGRFFVNVLFWQQFAVLENAGILDSLRESKNLARSGRNLRWFQRPWSRGAFIVSIWAAFVLAITLGSQWATLREYFNELMSMQDPQALLQKLSASSQAHRGFDVASFSLNLLQRILQPLLGIAFVLIYFDAKAGSVDESFRDGGN